MTKGKIVGLSSLIIILIMIMANCAPPAQPARVPSLVEKPAAITQTEPGAAPAWEQEWERVVGELRTTS